MKNQEIEELLSAKGLPCVTIIIPMHRLAPERMKDKKNVEKAILVAKSILKENYSKSDRTIDDLLTEIDRLANNIDYTHPKDGIGLYISPGQTKMIHFQFPVAEKVKIGETFDIRDLLYYIDGIPDYFVVALSNENIHLYDGKGEVLSENINTDFPLHYEETYEYSKPSRGNSFSSGESKEFERDKSEMQEDRMVAFFRNADHLLGKYIGNKLPVIIAGGNKALADYSRITAYSDRIIGKVTGSYTFDGEMPLTKHAWTEVQQHIKNMNNTLFQKYQELVGDDMVAIGLEEVWAAAAEGKGLELIVEKDFESFAYISENGYKLKLEKPHDKTHYNHVSDAVEKTIKTVLQKGGQVVFFENGTLKDFNGIALRLRYNENPK